MTRRKKRNEEADFWEMARSYLHSYLRKVRKVSPRTVDAYREALECYIAFLAVEKNVHRENICFDSFERIYVKDWLAWMQESKNYSPKTIALRLTGVKTFLSWCGDENLELAALYARIRDLRPPKAPKKPIEYLENDALAAVLAANGNSSKKSHRNRMMLVFLYETAIRVSELTSLSVGDLKLTKPAHISIVGKGCKARVVPLGNACVQHLRVYLEEFHHREKDMGSPLFYSMHGGEKTALSGDTVSRVLKEAADRARKGCPTVPGRIHCHMIRKTRAMDLYKSGVPLPIVMQVLGHESMATTSAFYAFATQEMMAEAIAASVPVAVSEDTAWLTEERKKALYSLR